MKGKMWLGQGELLSKLVSLSQLLPDLSYCRHGELLGDVGSPLHLGGRGAKPSG